MLAAIVAIVAIVAIAVFSVPSVHTHHQLQGDHHLYVFYLLFIDTNRRKKYLMFHTDFNITLPDQSPALS